MAMHVNGPGSDAWRGGASLGFGFGALTSGSDYGGGACGAYGAAKPAPAPAAAAVAPACSPALCVVLDGRQSNPGLRSELFRCWVGAMQEVMDLEPPHLPELAVITLHEGYYDSRLPLGKHTHAVLRGVLNGIEQDWVLSPLGLGAPIFGGTTAGGGAAKRKRAAVAVAEPRRLYAVGEDSSFAAIRTALAQLAAPARRGAAELRQLPRAAGLPAGGQAGRRLHFYTSEPERLLPLAAELRAAAPPGIALEVVAACRITGQDSGTLEHQEARARWLQLELRGGGDAQSCSITATSLPLLAPAFARKVRTLAEVTIPFVLRLPNNAEPRELLLSAAPSMLLPARTQSRLSAVASVVRELAVVCRLPAAGVSCELQYGVPLQLSAVEEKAAGAEEASPVSAALALLVRLLHEREEVLLLAGHADPMNWMPAVQQGLFVASPVLDDGGVAKLTLQGLASVDTYQPAAALPLHSNANPAS